jgi:hypothetical protein
MSFRLQHALDHANKRRHGRKAYVYAIECHGFVKVGVATSIAARMNQLQVGCPFELHLLTKWRSSDAIGQERRLHAMLKPFEERGEWFKLNAQSWRLIKEEMHRS